MKIWFQDFKKKKKKKKNNRDKSIRENTHCKKNKTKEEKRIIQAGGQGVACSSLAHRSSWHSVFFSFSHDFTITT